MPLGVQGKGTDFHAARSRVPCAPEKPVLFDSGASIVGHTILKGHMHRYEWSRDIDSGTAATRKSPLVNERYRRSRNRIFFWPKNPAHTDKIYTF